jgi:hypothetical protein
VAELLRRWIFSALRPPGGYRTYPTRANGQPAFVFAAGASPDQPTGVVVLSADAEAVTDITVFLDGRLAGRFI